MLQQQILERELKHQGANGSVQSQAVGQELKHQGKKTAQGGEKVTLCFFGDGATNNGVFAESMNFACMGQWPKGVPVIFLIENNQFGMTGRTRYEINAVDYLARRGWAYNNVGMHAEVVNGMSPLAVYDAVRRAGWSWR
jgi:TPP-dependent pyruvate/acetoin dehydrogenase alpha subunit